MNTDKGEPTMHRIAIIGAGAAGLVALRQFTAKPHVFKTVAFELSNQIGGTWVYTESTGTDDKGMPVHSSMYKNLKTNLPKEVMGFPDFPFENGGDSFIMHDKVLQYLQDYAKHFSLEQYIKFNTEVQLVTPRHSEDGQVTWEVQYRTSAAADATNTDILKKVDDSVETMIADAVVVCNGHYSVPLIPDLPGMSDFRGQIMHSHNYRHPEHFKDKVVCCLGAAASGIDITLDIAPWTKQVFLSHNKSPIKSRLPDNVTEQAGVKELTQNGVLFRNGNSAEIDVLLLCTGYRFTFPFLSKECKVKIEDERVTPLYKHIFHSEYPSLSFIGICKTVCPFPQFHNQAFLIKNMVEGIIKLPSRAEMDDDIERDYRWRLDQGMPHRHAHTMGKLQWMYNDELSTIGEFERIPKAVMILYDAVHEQRTYDVMNYKSRNYEINGPETYKEIT